MNNMLSLEQALNELANELATDAHALAEEMYEELAGFAAAWDAAQVKERAAWRAQATDWEIAISEPRYTLTAHQKILHDEEYA